MHNPDEEHAVVTREPAAPKGCTAGSGRGPLEKGPQSGNLASGLPVLVHGVGPITVTLSDRPGRLVIDVLDSDPSVPRTERARADDVNGRGLALVRLLSTRCAWEPVGSGKRVWAEMALPVAVEASPAAVPRGRPPMWAGRGAGVQPEPLATAAE
jgi:hypothetical protein